MRARTLITVVMVVALAVGFYFWQQHRAAANKPVPKSHAAVVDSTKARVGDAPVVVTAIGQIVSSHSVAIRPQVSGTLQKVFFTEGASVKAGDKLFEIDPAPYRAALQQAQASVARDRAGVQAAETQEKRLLPLADKGYVTPQEVLDAKATAASALAGVQVSQGAVAAAQVDVDRTVIRAPISGRTGALSVKTGNIVAASDAAPLVTINQLQPVQAEFTMPQGDLAGLQAAFAKGPVAVAVSAQSGGAPLAEGHLLFVDNTIDAVTGTVKLKAEFANQDEKLWPGSFVSFTATLATETDRVLVPELAVQPGADGSFVYVIGDDGKVQLEPVTVARQIAGEVVIASGLKGGENLVVRAPRDLKPGAVVEIRGAAKPEQNGDAPKPDAPAAASHDQAHS